MSVVGLLQQFMAPLLGSSPAAAKNTAAEASEGAIGFGALFSQQLSQAEALPEQPSELSSEVSELLLETDITNDPNATTPDTEEVVTLGVSDEPLLPTGLLHAEQVLFGELPEPLTLLTVASIPHKVSTLMGTSYTQAQPTLLGQYVEGPHVEGQYDTGQSPEHSNGKVAVHLGEGLALLEKTGFGATHNETPQPTTTKHITGETTGDVSLTDRWKTSDDATLTSLLDMTAIEATESETNGAIQLTAESMLLATAATSQAPNEALNQAISKASADQAMMQQLMATLPAAMPSNANPMAMATHPSTDSLEGISPRSTQPLREATSTAAGLVSPTNTAKTQAVDPFQQGTTTPSSFKAELAAITTEATVENQQLKDLTPADSRLNNTPESTPKNTPETNSETNRAAKTSLAENILKPSEAKGSTQTVASGLATGFSTAFTSPANISATGLSSFGFGDKARVDAAHNHSESVASDPSTVSAAMSAETSTLSSASMVSSSQGMAANFSASPEITNNVVGQVVNGAVQAHLDNPTPTKPTQVSLILNPEHLGSVRVQLTANPPGGADAGAIQARFIVTTPEAQALLTQQLESLSQRLESQNVRLDRIHVILAPEGVVASQSSSSSTGSGLFQSNDSSPQFGSAGGSQNSQQGPSYQEQADRQQWFSQLAGGFNGQGQSNPQGNGRSLYATPPKGLSLSGIPLMEGGQRAQSPPLGGVDHRIASGTTNISVLV